MDVGQSYGIHWVPQATGLKTTNEDHLLIDMRSTDGRSESQTSENDFLVHNMPTDIDQIAAENLIFMAREGQMVSDIICEDDINETTDHQIVGNADNSDGHFNEDYAEAQMVTEEVITDDWVQHQGEERVEIPVEQICGSNMNILQDSEVPLPTIQDEYTALRPYPCDFCSRRFRKKVSLMNHMVAHQNDRPHVCKLCGARFFRRSDLINHLKAHAESSEPEFDDRDFINPSGLSISSQQQGHSFHSKDHYYDQDWSYGGTRTHTSYNHHREKKFQHYNHNSHRQNKRYVNRLKPKEENYTIDETLRKEEQLKFLEQKMQREQQQVQIKHEKYEKHLIDKPLENDFTSNIFKSEDKDPSNHETYPILDQNKPFVCQQCGLAFAREKAMLSHCKTHRIEAPYECGICNDIFWDLPSLQDHQKTHQFEASNSEYEPEDVDDTQSDSESEYIYDRKQLDSEYFYCHECGMSFHRQHLLKRHSKLHVKRETIDKTKEGGHCCNTCGETFTEALDLLAHAEIHARYPPFKCILCGESFFEEETIKNHLHNVHGSELTENSCILCGKECRDRKALIKHAWDHSREKCHSCSKCGKNFHNKARLKRHMASHRDKSVICDVCLEEFPDGRTLSNHRHSHNTNATGKLFPCHECGKTFGSRSSQQIHLRIHTGERPYGCRFCWKAFADGGTLRKHERIHTGEKPYACSVCPRAFNQRVVLREHIRSHHSGIDKKYGTYHCSVCGSDLPNSTALIQHLIQHSDLNTAKQRQPITGPRKYKRRRKLKPHEIERLRGGNKQDEGSDVDMSDFDIQPDDLLEDEKEENSSKCNTKMEHATLSTETDNLEEAMPKKRYNSTGSTSSWQTKLINSSTNDDTYKSLLSNLENTLQSIDTLVVNNNSNNFTTSTSTSDGTISSFSNATNFTKNMTTTTTTMRKKEKLIKNSNNSKQNRPRMIHTERSRLTGIDQRKGQAARVSSDTISRRTKIIDISSAGLIKKNQSISVRPTPIEDDYDIISPENYPPNQISSNSLLNIKQEPNIVNSSYSRSKELFDAQLLLEAASKRSKDFEKYNPNIVMNDLDEILRSPDKTTTVTSILTTPTTPTERLNLENVAIKIEPISPQSNDLVRRSTRSRRPISSSKYLEFETDLIFPSPIRNESVGGGGSSTSSSGSIDKIKSDLKRNRTDLLSDLQVPISSSVVPSSMSVQQQQQSSQQTISKTNQLNCSRQQAPAMQQSQQQQQQQQKQRKQQYFECEMCSAVFPDRAQLLDHVPIHI